VENRNFVEALLRRSAGRRAIKECQQLWVDLILQRRAHTVRRAGITFSVAPLTILEESLAPLGTIGSSPP
jgi:hypothetical protein